MSDGRICFCMGRPEENARERTQTGTGEYEKKKRKREFMYNRKKELRTVSFYRERDDGLRDREHSVVSCRRLSVFPDSMGTAVYDARADPVY